MFEAIIITHSFSSIKFFLLLSSLFIVSLDIVVLALLILLTRLNLSLFLSLIYSFTCSGNLSLRAFLHTFKITKDEMKNDIAAQKNNQQPSSRYVFTWKQVLYPSNNLVKYFWIIGSICSHLSPTINLVNCSISVKLATFGLF